MMSQALVQQGELLTGPGASMESRAAATKVDMTIGGRAKTEMET